MLSACTSCFVKICLIVCFWYLKEVKQVTVWGLNKLKDQPDYFLFLKNYILLFNGQIWID